MKTKDILRREKMELTLDKLLNLFIATKQIEGKSKSTLVWYQRHIAKFYEYLGDGRISDLTLNNARSFIAYLQERDTLYKGHPVTPERNGQLSPHTIHGYVRAIKAMGTFLAEEGYTPTNPFKRLKRPSVPDTMIEVLSEDEIRRIEKSINIRCFIGARMMIIFHLLLDTGMRASELLGLELKDIDLKDQYCRVMGKGRKERVVPFGTITKKDILKYITTWRPEGSTEYLILSVDGTPLTYDALAHIVKRLGEVNDIPRLHPHLLRHTFAVRYLMNGGDLMTLRLILGHNSIETTQLYLKLSNQHIMIRHHSFSPIDRLAAREMVK